MPNVSGARFGAPTVREGLAASTRLIRQRPRSPFGLQLVRVREGLAASTALSDGGQAPRFVAADPCKGAGKQAHDDTSSGLAPKEIQRPRGIFLKNSRIRLPILLAALSLAHLGSLSAQFIIVTQDEDTISELQRGSLMTFSSGAIGEPVSRQITVTFDGPETSSALIATPRLAGSRGSLTFEFVSHAELPVRINPGESVTSPLHSLRAA